MDWVRVEFGSKDPQGQLSCGEHCKPCQGKGELQSATVTGGSVSPLRAVLCPDMSGSCLVGVDSPLVVERPHGVPLAPFETSHPQGGLELKGSS